MDNFLYLCKFFFLFDFTFFFPFLNQIFTLSLVSLYSHYGVFLTLPSFFFFFFIINVGPVCPSEVVAW